MSNGHLGISVDFHRSRPLVVIVGPTGVGKSAIALTIAENLSAEIVSADSRLLYLGMDIGTDKPSLEERARVPHHLIDVAPPDQIWSLAQYQTIAYKVIDAIHMRNRLPIMVGGTGQYIHAVTQGWTIPPAKPNQILRKALEKWAVQIGPQSLHGRLAHLDPQAAASIEPSNLRRTVRALEVIFSTGQPFSAQKTRQSVPYNIIQVGITRPRPELYQRVDDRIDRMLESGFTGEVHHLLQQGYSPDLPTMSAIGYREMVAFVLGQCSLSEAVTLMKRRTRIYIRRQANWFKLDDPVIDWFPAGGDTAGKIEQAVRFWLVQLSNLPNQKHVHFGDI